ncbi:nucleus accumbens-associated protein 1-like isoform X1 [Sitodiplosis mosellana]|uniref:nucleus accumbens-associated protein 1-like isoform X1 n=1 Tax=Sitodiplosis mosellana TaxID=263140 RepID=UPI002444A0F0|nr:nucleus accumbens-associated protein 1-like isoform X1 [Sitodiplosis mosellana]XP_055311313.1 nucleus accumbens-associated protein 1-like isoform X1 [Sitodiplosis mosellana]
MSVTANISDKIPMKLSQNVESQAAFCLRWNNFQSNMLDVFERLFLDECFVDVTLACEGQLIKAHKMVLSASSSYFQEIFTTTPCTHPVIIMKDVPLKDLRKILEFMYKGEINVSKPEITSLLLVAEALHVRGLAQIDTSNEEPQPSTSNADVLADMQKSNKVNRLLKRESSVESLVLIEDESLLQPAKQAKMTANDTSQKSESPQNTPTDELAYNSMREAEDDFLESAAEYDADDFDPIAVDSIQIKQEEDIISNYSTDNGASAFDLEVNSDSLLHTGSIETEQGVYNELPPTMEDMFNTFVQDQKAMLRRVQMLEESMNRHPVAGDTLSLQSCSKRLKTTNAPMTIDKIATIEDFLRFENAVVNDLQFRANVTNALVERLGGRYKDDRISCAIMINRLLIVPEFFKLCSWTGRTKDETQEKFPMQKHSDFLEFFNSVVRQSSTTVLSENELKHFFSSRIKNSFYSPKTNRYMTRKRAMPRRK